MVKEYFRYIFAFAALTLSACTDNSYSGELESFNNAYLEKIPVAITIGDPHAVLMTKGSGAKDYDDPSVWDDAEIYVYAFKRDLTTSFASTSLEDTGDCLIDASRDYNGDLGGKRAKINKLDSYLIWLGVERVVYYPYGSVPHDFYAYYLDDLKIGNDEILRNEDNISLSVEIDGTQDLMSSYAELTDSQLYKDGLSDKDRLNLISFSYSATTAKQDVQPVMYFKHHLARLRFEIYPGVEKAKDIYVESITVKSRSKAIFTVANKYSDNIGLDFSISDEYKVFDLTEEDGSALRQKEYHPIWDDAYYGTETSDPVMDPYEREAVTVGGSVLVAPDEEYEIFVRCREYTPYGTEKIVELPFTITTKDRYFAPGNQYQIRIALYGEMNMDVVSELVPWGYVAGDQIIDPDEWITETQSTNK